MNDTQFYQQMFFGQPPWRVDEVKLDRKAGGRSNFFSVKPIFYSLKNGHVDNQRVTDAARVFANTFSAPLCLGL